MVETKRTLQYNPNDFSQKWDKNHLTKHITNISNHKYYKPQTSEIFQKK